MAGESHVNLERARSAEQRRTMEEIHDGGYCPFCPENLQINHKMPILRRGEHWTLTPSQWPYENTRVHLLAISAFHAVRLRDLPPVAGSELLEHMQWAEAEYDIESGALALRFGDTADNGASVAHLHAHLIVPDENRPEGTKIRFKMSG
jgi:ATP adenylyltransferase